MSDKDKMYYIHKYTEVYVKVGEDNDYDDECERCCHEIIIVKAISLHDALGVYKTMLRTENHLTDEEMPVFTTIVETPTCLTVYYREIDDGDIMSICYDNEVEIKELNIPDEHPWCSVKFIEY